MPWILSNIRIGSIGLFICVLAPCFVLASSAAEKSPKAVIQLFYKALREGKYEIAQQNLSRESQEYIKNITEPVDYEMARKYADLYSKAMEEGKEAEALEYLSRAVQSLPRQKPKVIDPAKVWAAMADKHTKNGTLQTVEVSEVTTFSVPEAGEKAVMCSVLTRFAGGSVRQLRIALVKEGRVWKIFWAGKLEMEQAFQDYVVRIYSVDDLSTMFSGYFEISQRDRRVYLSHLQYSLGNFGFGHKGEYDQKGNYTEKIVVPFGKDITGDGNPNIVVFEWAVSGTHCCSVYHIFAIGRKFRKIAKIEGGDGSVDFADLDGDSKLELVLSDWTFKYFLSDFASYDPPDVILRYQEGAYRIAVDLMHKPAPSHEELERRAKQARNDTIWEGKYWPKYGWVPESLGATLLELLYTGHPDLAWKYLERAWPPDISGKDAWLSRFRAKLDSSQFWPLDSKRAYFVP